MERDSKEVTKQERLSDSESGEVSSSSLSMELIESESDWETFDESIISDDITTDNQRRNENEGPRLKVMESARWKDEEKMTEYLLSFPEIEGRYTDADPAFAEDDDEEVRLSPPVIVLDHKWSDVKDKDEDDDEARKAEERWNDEEKMTDYLLSFPEIEGRNTDADPGFADEDGKEDHLKPPVIVLKNKPRHDQVKKGQSESGNQNENYGGHRRRLNRHGHGRQRRRNSKSDRHGSRHHHHHRNDRDGRHSSYYGDRDRYGRRIVGGKPQPLRNVKECSSSSRGQKRSYEDDSRNGDREHGAEKRTRTSSSRGDRDRDQYRDRGGNFK